MKQKQIKELLKNTRYQDVTLSATEEWLEGSELAHIAVEDDAIINAARVQLLAKALYQARAELAREGCELEVAAIDAALTEAGMEG